MPRNISAPVRTQEYARLPPPVLPGDRVGVAAISGPVDPGRLEAGLRALQDLGLRPVSATNLGLSTELFAGSDDERLAAFHALAADPAVKAIFFARGGHGVLRVLPHVDWELLGRFPRAYMGYSDLTPLLMQVVERLGLVAFHGPMVAADLARGLGDEERQSFLDALAGRYPRILAVRPGSGPLPEGKPAEAKPVEGRLVGGCLSLLAATLGTPWSPRLENALLFLEEVDEPLYRFDRMLTQLRLSGRLTGIQGLVTGHLIGVDKADETERHGTRRSHDVLRELASFTNTPFAWGLEAGHASPNLTLPLGMWARLEPTEGRLVLGPRTPIS